ncbi:MAG TPA: RidA family protein [Clostridiales bacterium]|jgi:2-iminobutanoate/2-iminopropanoate deaminase|nr:RidA family protein [Clostridiales bacterium]
MAKIIHTDRAPGAVGPYSQAVALNDLLFVSGQIPIDPATGQLVEGGVEQQTEQVMKNLRAIIEAAGLTLDNIVKATIFLVDIEDFGAVNQVYQSFFSGDYPARSCVAVRELPKKGVRVEIEAIAGR